MGNATPTPTSPTPVLSQQVIDATVKSLAQTLAQITGQTLEQTIPFAQQWAPQAAVWAEDLAAAQKAGNAAAVARYQTDLKLLTDDAALRAADFGVNLQGASEGTGIAAFKAATSVAANFLGQLAISLIAAA